MLQNISPFSTIQETPSFFINFILFLILPFSIQVSMYLCRALLNKWLRVSFFSELLVFKDFLHSHCLKGPNFLFQIVTFKWPFKLIGSPSHCSSILLPNIHYSHERAEKLKKKNPILKQNFHFQFSRVGYHFWTQVQCSISIFVKNSAVIFWPCSKIMKSKIIFYGLLSEALCSPCTLRVVCLKRFIMCQWPQLPRANKVCAGYQVIAIDNLYQPKIKLKVWRLSAMDPFISFFTEFNILRFVFRFNRKYSVA